MTACSLPWDGYELLVEALDEREKAETFALFIAIALLALTLANPTFAALVGRLFP